MKKVANIKSLIRTHYHACQAEDWDEAADIILEAYEFLRYSHYLELLENLCKSLLPVDWQDGKQLISSISKHIDILHRLGVTYYDSGKFVKSNQYLECSFKLAKQTGYRIIEVDSLSYIALNHQQLENYKIAIEYLKNCLVIAQEIQEVKLECRTLQFLAKTHEYLDNYQEAIEYYLEAQKIANQHEFFEGKVTVIANLGLTHIRLKNYDLGLDYMNQYLVIYEDFSQVDNQLYALKDLSSFRSNIRDSHDILNLVQQQAEIYIDLADRNNEANDVNVLTTVYDALEDWKRFIKIFEKCLSVISETNSIQNQVNSLYESGIFYHKIYCLNRDIIKKLYTHNSEVMLLVELVKIFFKGKIVFEKTIKYNLTEAEKICINLELPFLTQIQQLQADLQQLE